MNEKRRVYEMILRRPLAAALPPGLFSSHEQSHILDTARRTWRVRQAYPRPPRVIAHPAWQRLVGG